MILDLCKEKKNILLYIIILQHIMYFLDLFIISLGVYVIKETTTFHCESLE